MIPYILLIITGLLDHGPNADVFGVPLPAPFVMTAMVNPLAEDEDPLDSAYGEFLTLDGKLTFDFGSRHIETQGVEVQVRSDKDGLSGFSVGNAFAFTEGEYAFDEYFGVYFSELTNLPQGSEFFQTDLLSNLTQEGADELLSITYAYAQATTLDGGIEGRIQDTEVESVVVSEVPEPGAFGLCVLGFLAIVLGRL